MSLANGLILDLPMNEGAGTGLADRSGYGQHFLFDSLASPWIGSSRGHAVQFDGSGWAELSRSTNLSQLPAFTVSIWVNGAGVQSTAYLLSHYDTVGNQRSWAMTTGQSDTSKLRVAMSDDGTFAAGNAKVLESSITAFDGGWHHVAFAWRPGFLSLHVDGRLDPNPTLTFGTSDIDVLHDSTNDHLVGAFGSGAGWFSGQMSSVNVWRRALSGQEIRQHFNDTYIPRA